MAAGKKILIGCGIGCGGLLLLVILSVAGGAFWVGNTMKGFSEAVELRAEIEARHGTVDDFTPPDDGAVALARMAAFLAVREASQASREKIVEAFRGLPMTERAARDLDEQPFLRKLASVFRIGGSALDLAGELGEFFAARNQALLDQGIGLGEYTYIYVLTYHSWLGHSPRDNPGGGRIVIDGPDDEPAEAGSQFDLGLDRRIRRNLIRMLHNQLAVVEESGAGDEWAARLAAEIENLENDRESVPWADGLPGAIAASFEPYREQLESTYSPVTNAFELARNRRRGSFSIQAD